VVKQHTESSSLRSKRSRTKRTKFWPRVLVFCILDERKMGQEQKRERKGVGEGKKRLLVVFPAKPNSIALAIFKQRIPISGWFYNSTVKLF